MRAAAPAAALTAALFLPGERLGIAVPLVVALMIAAVAVAGRRAEPHRRSGPRLRERLAEREPLSSANRSRARARNLLGI